jgi:GNAT superfamily N-acetyltransferase
MTTAVVALDDDTVDAAGRVMADEHASVRARLGLPVAFAAPGRCADALAGLLAAGYRGVVAMDRRRCVGVLCARLAVAHEAYASAPAHGVALHPGLDDPTSVLGAMYGDLAPDLLHRGALWHVVTAVDRPAVGEALADLGFGRHAVYAAQPARPATPGHDVEVRIGTAGDLESITALSQVEVDHRFTPPIWSPPHPSMVEDTRARHARLLQDRAVHLIASAGGHDVGLLTIERSPQPRLCDEDEPYVGATATVPPMRGRGVGQALVAAALDWSYGRGFHTLSVDFQPANPLSRPFWLGAGFRPVGYGYTRAVHPVYGPAR